MSQALISKTETSITMEWAFTSECDMVWYSVDGQNWVECGSGESGTYTIDGLSPLTTYNIVTRMRDKQTQVVTETSSLTVETFDYPHAVSMPNFKIGDKVTIGLYNPLSRLVTINLIGADDSICGSAQTSGSVFSGFDGELVVYALYETIPQSIMDEYSVAVLWNEHTETRTGGVYAVNVGDCAPSIASLSYMDTNQDTVVMTGDNQKIVQSQSVFSFTATGIYAKHSATVVSCVLTVNGIDYVMSLNASVASGGNAVIDSSNNFDAVITVTDSRGITAQRICTVTMLAWYIPTAVISLSTCGKYGSCLMILPSSLPVAIFSAMALTFSEIR